MTAKDSKSTDKTVNKKPDGPFTVRFLMIIKKLQQLHGLRHGDYQRYRNYCTRRIRRLRRSLHLPQGDKRHFRKRPITAAHLDNEKAVEIPLIMAERAWSYAMQLRIEANTELRKKYHVTSRLRKAVNCALDLQKLCDSDTFDASTKLEAEAYVGWMRGTLYFELKSWTEAIENLKTAQVIYKNLSISLGAADENVIFYNQRIDELTPSIRYCAYNIGDETAIEELLQLRTHAQGDLLKNIDIVMKQLTEDTSSSLSLDETKWLGKPLAVKSEKVKVFLISDRDLEKTFDQNTVSQNIELLEQHLMDCKDAISAVQDEINTERAQKTARANVIAQLQHQLSYLTYVKLQRTICRNLFLSETAKKNLVNPLEKYKRGQNAIVKDAEDQKSSTQPNYLSRLYELSLQHITEIEQIVGTTADDHLRTSLQMQKSAFTSFRCYYVGLQLVSIQNWNMAVAIFNEAARHAEQALSSCVSDSDEKLAAQLRQLLPSINFVKCTVCALSVLGASDEEQSGGVVGVATDDKQAAVAFQTMVPLYERLDIFDRDPTLITDSVNPALVCPNLKPMPYKPLFFDLVHDKLRMPALKLKTQQDKKAPVAAGLTGFVKGIWGWGGSKQ